MLIQDSKAKSIIPIIKPDEPKSNNWAKAASGLFIPEQYIPKAPPKAFDFFAGCGGFSLGFMKAGYQVIGALEMDKYAAHTYMVNLGKYPMKIHFDTKEREADFEKYMESCVKKVIKKRGFIATSSTLRDRIDENLETFGLAGSGWISSDPANYKYGCEHFWIADIRNLKGKKLLETIGLEIGELDAVMGGPPCQGFSKAGKQDEADPRNNLVFEFGRMIIEMQPKTFVMEEVPDFVDFQTPEGINILDGLMKMLADGDYAPLESLRKAMFGRKNAKVMLRREKKQMNKKRKEENPKGKSKQKILKDQTQPVQSSLF